MELPWVEKYRPKSLREIVGNNQIIAEMKKWAMEWDKGNIQKPLILVGKPGCGKTTAAKALANDMHWGVIELNASDVRNEENIKRIAMVGAVNETFTDEGEFISSKRGGRKLIIFDEADNLYEGKDDRGGKKAIVETIKVSKQPIILIGNDYYSIVSGTWGAKLRSMCKVLKFRALTNAQMIKILSRICKAEGIVCDRAVLDMIAGKADGDLRAAINDLQAVAQGKKVVKITDVKSIGLRDEKSEIYSATMVTLRTEHFKHAKEIMRNLDETPDFVMLWLEENLPLEYQELDDLVRGYEYISKADVYLGRVMKRQQYALWGYAMDMLAGVSVAKKEKYKKHPFRYNFPTWLRNMSKSKEARNRRESVSAKVGRIYHTSPGKVKENILPHFRVLYDLNPELRALYTYVLHFDRDEIEYLTKKDAEKILKDAQKIGEEIEKRGEGGSS